MIIKHCLGEFINQLQMNISSSKVLPTSEFQQWVNQEENKDFWWCPFPPPHRNITDQVLVQTWALCLRVCVLFLENLGLFFFSKIIELLTLTRKPPSNGKDIHKYDRAFHMRNWEKCNPRNYCKQVKLVLRRLKNFFPWTTKQGLGYVKIDQDTVK